MAVTDHSGWLIRAASRPADGGGHIARCLALGDVLRAGGPVWFWLDDDSQAATVRAHGHQTVGGGIPPTRGWAGSVIDGYAYTADDAKRLRDLAPPLVAIDDFLTAFACADLLVNGGANLSGQEVAGTAALLGPAYALIDPRFSALPTHRAPALAQHVLISFGRHDPADATSRALTAMTNEKDCDITVALGRPAVHIDRVRSIAGGLGGHVRVVVDGDMRELFATCDLVIGAGGVGLNERMAAGLPSLTIATADNQVTQADGAARHGATSYLGRIETVQDDTLRQAITQLRHDQTARRELAARARRLIDGRGPERVAAAMVTLSGQFHSQAAATA